MQAHKQGFEVSYLNIYPIYDLLEYMKDSCGTIAAEP